jgi:hypothetical protein
VLYVFIPTTPTTPMSAEVGVFLVTLVVVMANMSLILWLRPYTVRREWKKPVKLLALLVTLAGAVSNLVCAAYHQGVASVLAADASAFSVFGCILFWKAVWVDAQTVSGRIQRIKQEKSRVFVNNPLVTRSSTGQRKVVDKGRGDGRIGERVFVTRITREGKAVIPGQPRFVQRNLQCSVRSAWCYIPFARVVL